MKTPHLEEAACLVGDGGGIRSRRRGRQKRQKEPAVADGGEMLDLCGACVRELLLERKALASGMVLQREEYLEHFQLNRNGLALARRGLDEARALEAKCKEQLAQMEGIELFQGCGCGAKSCGVAG